MKSAALFSWGLGFWVCLTLGGLAAAAADEWTVDLRVGGGDVSSDMVRATEFVLEFPPLRATFRDRLEYDVSPISLTTLELRRFWSPRWASSLRARYSVLEVDATGESSILVENTETGEIEFETVDFQDEGIVTNDPGRIEAIELALGVEFHPAPRGRVDPFVGVSIGTVDYQPENQSFIRELNGDLAFGVTAGLNVDLSPGSYFVVAARWDSLEAKPFRSRGSLTTILEQDDGLTASTLEAGIGVRFGSGGD